MRFLSLAIVATVSLLPWGIFGAPLPTNTLTRRLTCSVCQDFVNNGQNLDDVTYARGSDSKLKYFNNQASLLAHKSKHANGKYMTSADKEADQKFKEEKNKYNQQRRYANMKQCPTCGKSYTTIGGVYNRHLTSEVCKKRPDANAPGPKRLWRETSTPVASSSGPSPNDLDMHLNAASSSSNEMLPIAAPARSSHPSAKRPRTAEITTTQAAAGTHNPTRDAAHSTRAGNAAASSSNQMLYSPPAAPVRALASHHLILPPVDLADTRLGFESFDPNHDPNDFGWLTNPHH